MAQKANLLSIRRENFFQEGFTQNVKLFLLIHNFLETFSQVLTLKNIIVLRKFLTFNGNESFLNISIFFKASKIDKIVKFLTFKKISKEKKLSFTFLNLLKRSFLDQSLISLKLKIKVLNFYVNKNIVKHSNFFLKIYIKFLFERRFKLYIDFLQLISLYYQNHLTNYFFLHNLALIFSRLKKKRHSKFLSFIKDLLNFLIIEIPQKFDNKHTNSKICGMKFVLKGKIRGKTRSQYQAIQVGSVPNQSIAKNISFSKISVITPYGVYGLKLWTYRTN
jgi:hypothetical protein